MLKFDEIYSHDGGGGNRILRSRSRDEIQYGNLEIIVAFWNWKRHTSDKDISAEKELPPKVSMESKSFRAKNNCPSVWCLLAMMSCLEWRFSCDDQLDLEEWYDILPSGIVSPFVTILVYLSYTDYKRSFNQYPVAACDAEDVCCYLPFR